MNPEHTPTATEFESFFETYLEACTRKDRDFFRGILPAGIPAEEFEFVVESSAEFAAGMKETGAKPVFEQDGMRFDAVFREGEGGDACAWRLDFYFSGGRWLKYDPDAPGPKQGW